MHRTVWALLSLYKSSFSGNQVGTERMAGNIHPKATIVPSPLWGEGGPQDRVRGEI